MALLSQLHLALFLSFLPFLAIATSHHHQHHHHNHHHDGGGGLKSMHFTLYQHETINKTGYIIVEGVVGPGVSQTTTPFGTIFAFQDPLKAGPTESSEVLGLAEGTSITSSLDGLRSISVATIMLDLEGHKGSLSTVGVVHNTQRADLPVVGGTGDFMFAQGYVTSSPVDLKGVTVVYKIQFHLYWPPYASHLVAT